MNINSRLKKLTVTALLAALVFVITFLVRVPMPAVAGGYINLGDTVIYLGAMLLGGWPGAAAAAIGSGLSDLLAGFPIYAPATFIIKGLMGLACGLLAKRGSFARFTFAAFISGVIMVAGYFLYEVMIFDVARAVASVPFNAVQLVGGVAFALILYPAVKRIPAIK
jgi:uncharacterized membrane protein